MHNGGPAVEKKLSILSNETGLNGSESPSPKLCVTGESTPSKTAYAPAHSIQVAPLAG